MIQAQLYSLFYRHLKSEQIVKGIVQRTIDYNIVNNKWEINTLN